MLKGLMIVLPVLLYWSEVVMGCAQRDERFFDVVGKYLLLKQFVELESTFLFNNI